MAARGSEEDNLSLLLPTGTTRDALKVLNTPQYGRGVYSKRLIPAGTAVLPATEPLTHVISPHERGIRCDWCLNKDRSLRKCGKCKFVWYCSQDCQRHDWTYHKMECEGIARISPKIPTDTVRLIIRLLIHKSLGNNTLELPAGALWDMDVLTTNAPRYNVELKESLGEQVIGVKLLASNKMDLNLELAFEIACKMISNSFSILDWEMNSIGSGVYIVPALFNHSCDPNCIALFEGRKMSLRTIKEIGPNEQLFVSYTDLMETRERRQRHLQKYYMFTCDCLRCSEDFIGSLDEKLIQTITDLKPSETKTILKEGFAQIDEIEKMKKKGEWPSSISTVKEYLTSKLPLFGDSNIITVKMRESLMDAYIETEQWNDALEVARLLKDPYQLYYHQINPFIGLHFYKMAKLIQQVSDTKESLKESVELLDKAVGILSITHGSQHSSVQDAKGILYETGMELKYREEKKGRK